MSAERGPRLVGIAALAAAGTIALASVYAFVSAFQGERWRDESRESADLTPAAAMAAAAEALRDMPLHGSFRYFENGRGDRVVGLCRMRTDSPETSRILDSFNRSTGHGIGEGHWAYGSIDEAALRDDSLRPTYTLYWRSTADGDVEIRLNPRTGKAIVYVAKARSR